MSMWLLFKQRSYGLKSPLLSGGSGFANVAVVTALIIVATNVAVITATRANVSIVLNFVGTKIFEYFAVHSDWRGRSSSHLAND